MMTVSPQICERIRQPKTVTFTAIAVLSALFLLGVGAKAISVKAPITTDLKKAAQMALANKPVEGLKILARLDESTMNETDRDLFRLTKARVLTQAGQLDLAVENYNAVSSKSDFWIDALEEKAEVTARTGNYAKAIGILQTTLAPQFKDKIHPETYFVAALTHLKICDYPGVFKVTEQFKKEIQPRLKAWREQAALGDKTAKASMAETSMTVSQLQVIEADVIHRMALADGAANGPQQGKIAKGADVLTFPQSDEVWSDELDHFSAEVKECQPTRLHLTASNKRAAL